jgi:hypothetical protein
MKDRLLERELCPAEIQARTREDTAVTSGPADLDGAAVNTRQLQPAPNHGGSLVIFVLRLYEVNAVDAHAFTAAFDEDGPWRRLSGRLRGYIHTDLLVRSTFPTVLLLLEFWQSEQHYAIAERNAEVREFLRSLRNLAVSHQSLGVFYFRSQREKDMIQGSSFQMPADLSGCRLRQ